MAFFSCLYMLVKYLLVFAVIGLFLGRFAPIANFIPTAIGYFFISFLFLVISGPLYLTSYKKRASRISKVDPIINRQEMPVIQPIPNATKNQDGWFDKLLAYLFVPRTWLLMQNWHWVYTENMGKQNERKVMLVIPKGFEFDAASIPRSFRALFNPTGALLLPALLHDFAYKYNQLWECDGKDNFIVYNPFKDLPLEKQREGWDDFLYDVGGQLNGLPPVNWTIRLLGRIGLTRETWDNYRTENATVIVPVKPAPKKKCLCKYNP